MSLTKEDLKNISDLFTKRFDEIGDSLKFFEENVKKRLENLERKGELYELSFGNIDRKLESIDGTLLKLMARENLNRDRLDRAELYIDDLKRLFVDSYPKVCDEKLKYVKAIK